MANNRTNREQDTRAQETRYEYVPASTLPDPTPEPGFTYRWIATAILGQANPTNVSQKFRDGWVPVKAVDHPELMVQGDTNGNGYIRTTFGVEDWQTGTTVFRMSKADYDALSTAVPVAP